MFVIKFIIVLVALARFVNLQGIPNDFDDQSDEQMDAVMSNIDKSEKVIVGDMIFTKDQFTYLFSNNSAKRHGLKSSFTQWPKAIVPFVFARNATDGVRDRSFAAMKYIMERSCIKFKPKDEYDPNFLVITMGQPSSCSSQVGNMRSGPQALSLSDECQTGNIVHELLHTLGFLHMHTATERDHYVRINWKNIMPKLYLNFQRYSSYVSMFDTQYDYESIMHYSNISFAIRDGLETITPLGMAYEMGQRKRMSRGDIVRLNRMYKCNQYNDFPDKLRKLMAENEDSETVQEDAVSEEVAEENTEEYTEETTEGIEDTAKVVDETDLKRVVPEEEDLVKSVEKPVKVKPAESLAKPVKAKPAESLAKPVKAKPAVSLTKPVESLAKPVKAKPVETLRRPVIEKPEVEVPDVEGLTRQVKAAVDELFFAAKPLCDLVKQLRKIMRKTVK